MMTHLFEELRYGNWMQSAGSTLEGQTPRYFQLIRSDLEYIFSGESLAKPIELTLEILEKIGFRKTEKSVWSELYIGELCEGQKTWIVTEGRIFGLMTTNEDSMKPSDVADIYNFDQKDNFLIIPENQYLWLPESIKYVHQLQNIVFSLTGKDLTIDL